MSSIGNRDQLRAVCGDIIVYIQEVNPRRMSGKRPLHLRSWNTIKDIKQTLQELLHVPMSKQRLFFRGQELGPRGPVDGGSSLEAPVVRELKTYTHSLQDCGIVRDGETIYFTIASGGDLSRNDAPVLLRSYGLTPAPKRLIRSLKQVRRAMEMGVNGPKLTLEGFGGTYFMYDPRRRPLACFKPSDEEPYTPNNPRGRELVANWGMVGKEIFQMRPGVRPGEGYIREVAAFLMDHNGFCGVPATMVVEARHKAFHSESGKEEVKVGSFQEFVKHDAVVEDLSPSLFSRREVQKIALLDLRLLNSDRNGGNILVRKRSRRGDGGFTPVSSYVGQSHHDYQLIPIDHGYCLPEELCIDDSLNLCWFEWRQLKEPMDNEVVTYIKNLDAERDAKLLQQELGIREAALDNLRLTTMLLKLAAEESLTLYDVALMVVREVAETPSELEQVKEMAQSLAHAVARSGKIQKLGITKLAPRRSLVKLDESPVKPQRPTAQIAVSSPTGSDEQLNGHASAHGHSQASSCSSFDEMTSSSELETVSTSFRDDDYTPTGSLVNDRPSTAPLRIRLDVIEGTDAMDDLYNRPAEVMVSPSHEWSPGSPLGFWHESLSAMNARAAMAAAHAAADLRDVSPRSLFSPPSTISSPTPTKADLPSLPFRSATEGTDDAFVFPATGGAANGGGGGGVTSSSAETTVPVNGPLSIDMILSDDDTDSLGAGGAGSTFSQPPCTRREKSDIQSQDEGGYSWAFDMDMDTGDGISALRQESSSSSATSSASSSPSSANHVRAELPPRGGASALSVQQLRQREEEEQRHDHGHHTTTHATHHKQQHSMQHHHLEGAAPDAAGDPTRGAVMRSISGDASPKTAVSMFTKSHGVGLTRAISTPDLKKTERCNPSQASDSHSTAAGRWGESGHKGSMSSVQLCSLQQSMTIGVGGSQVLSRAVRKDKDIRESTEFRQCFLHYAGLLLRDLVRRKVRQRGQATEVM